MRTLRTLLLMAVMAVGLAASANAGCSAMAQNDLTANTNAVTQTASVQTPGTSVHIAR